MQKLIWFGFLVISLAACGGSDSAGNASDGGASRGGSGIDGWTLVLQPQGDAHELADIEGKYLSVQKRGHTVQLNGLGSDVGSLLATIAVGDAALEASDYNPTLFSVTWEGNDYRCVGGSSGVTISFSETDPARGSYAGTLTCQPGIITPDSGFEITFSGEFGQNL